MKNLLTLLPVLVLSTSGLYAQTAPTAAAAPDKAAMKEQESVALSDADEDFRTRFSNLSDEKKAEYFKITDDIRKFFAQKRIFEALDKTEAAEKVIPNHPGILNFRAACYVEFRAFDKARTEFAKALEISPKNTSIRFNAGELEFVTKNYEKALAIFDSLEKEMVEAKQQNSYLYLIQFKKMLCYISTGKDAEIEKYLKLYDDTTDSPYYYYANAANNYRKNNNTEAEIWVARGNAIFNNPAIVAPWQDTMIEYGYIKSFYGDTNEATSAPAPAPGQ